MWSRNVSVGLGIGGRGVRTGGGRRGVFAMDKTSIAKWLTVRLVELIHMSFKLQQK
jgi:hypothetical protein